MAESNQLVRASEKAKDTRLRRVYKTTLPEQNAKRASQNNACAICQRSFTKYMMFQDHDHACCKPKRGKAAKNNAFCGKCNRGLLCYLCNKYAVGLLEWLHTMEIDFEKVVVYKREWDQFLKANGAYAPKEESPKKLRSSKKGVRRSSRKSPKSLE